MSKAITTIAIVLLLMFAMAVSLVAVPAANAHDPALTLPTFCFVAAAPNPAQIGQPVNVFYWINVFPPTSLNKYGDVWHGFTVVVKAPDGTSETLGPFNSDPTGSGYLNYKPKVIGNYTFQAFFGGDTVRGENPPPGLPPNPAIGDYYEPSESEVFTLMVQEEPIYSTPYSPLPTQYWTRPIYAENTNWYEIGGNWFGLGTGVGVAPGPGLYNATSNYNAYTSAPTSSHILWTKPVAFGGTIGGEFGGSQQSNYYSTPQYEIKFSPIIINGILYYTQFPGSMTYPTGWSAVDLRTGQTLWTVDQPRVSPGLLTSDSVATEGAVTLLRAGQVLNFISPNQYGGLPYLWSIGTPAMVASSTNIQAGTTTYNMFDATTGTYILSVVNGTNFDAMTLDESGNLVCYYINASTANAYNAPTLNQWNATKAIMEYSFEAGTITKAHPANNIWSWRPPKGGIVPFSYGIDWSEPIATNISGDPITLSYSGISSGVILMVQYSTAGRSTGLAFQRGWIIEAGYSAVNGQLLWGPINRTQTPDTRVAFGNTRNGNTGASIGNGFFVECNVNTETLIGYNLHTGEKVWGPKQLPNVNPVGQFGWQQVNANDTLYVWTYGGDVYAINLKTGDIKWEYHTPNGGSDTPYGTMPLWVRPTGTVANGMLFLSNGHEFNPPLFRGAQAIALNITNGELVWNITAFMVNSVKAIADGIMVALNSYDNQVYAFGKGPTKTTIMAPSIEVTTATPITITGSVTDISAGSQQQALTANFPNGLPAVSDATMTKFMEAVYMQQPMPNDVTGVLVTLSVIDTNGNYREIGTTTSNAMGTYGFTWTPDIPGDYTVIATFAGSESYYGSSAQTYFYASEAPAATPAPTASPASTADLYLVPGIIGIIIAIAVVGAIIVLMLRKR